VRYLLKQKVFSFNKFVIKNETGEDAFLVDGKVFSFGNKFLLRNMRGEELAFIKQKNLTWLKTYDIYRCEKPAATIRQPLFTLRNTYRVTVPGGKEVKITGNFTSCEYTFERVGQVIARASQRWFSLSDAYGVEIAQGEDEVLILCCALVIDVIRKSSG